jgi:hypothetical protein
MSAIKRHHFSPLLFILLVATAAGLLRVSSATAQALNQTIDLVRDSGLRNVSQRAFLWRDLAIGPNQDVKMWQCGCFLAALSTIFEYEFVGAPWFLTDFLPFGPPGPQVTLFNFNPHYLDLYSNSGPAQDKDSGWGYKLRPGCGVTPKPFATAGAASFGGRPGGLVLVMNPGLHNPAARSIVNRNLLDRRPTIVIRRMTPEEVRAITGQDGPAGLHAQLIVGWDNEAKKYLIIDPLQGPEALPNIPRTLGGTYDDWEQSTVNIIVAEPSVDGFFYILFGDDPSPIEIQMIDPEGRRTGFDPATQGVFQEAPAASYWNLDGWVEPLGEVGLGDPVKFVVVRNPAGGTYRFQVTGTGDGPFSVSAISMGATRLTRMESR